MLYFSGTTSNSEKNELFENHCGGYSPADVVLSKRSIRSDWHL